MTVTDEHEHEHGHAREPQLHPEEGHHGPHPSDRTYIYVALFLAFLTAVEVAVSYIKGLELAGNPILIILAAAKFVLVVFFFMHLRFDSPLLRRLFFGGLVLASFCYVAVLLMFQSVFWT